MTFSAKKPYQRTDLGVREFYRAPARTLKDSIGPESVYEKPYVTKEYGDMQQSLNTPSVPTDITGGGITEGLVCIYNPDDCEIFASCYAGGAIKINGGPEEAGAGYVDPVIIKGGLAGWYVAEDKREIHLTFDAALDQNIIEVGFVDGWGEKHIETLDSLCIVSDCGFSSDDYFVGSDGDAPNSQRWTRVLQQGTLCQIDSKGGDANFLMMYTYHSWPSNTATLTHNVYFTGNVSLALDYWHSSSHTEQTVVFSFRIRNIVTGDTFRFELGHVSNVKTARVKTYDGSTTEIFTDSDNKYNNGRLNIVRSGGSVEILYAEEGSSSWISLASWGGFGIDAIRVRLQMGPTGIGDVRYYFDNFVVTGGGVIC